MKESFLWILLFASHNVQLTTALGVLSLRFVSYSNPDGKTADGSCCEHIFAIFGCGSGDCDPSFTICIHDNTQTGSCSNLQYRVGPYDNTGAVSFGSKLGGLDNPIQVQFQMWKSQFSVNIDVYDDDSDGAHDQIGTITLTPSKVPGYNGSNSAYTENLQGGFARLQVQYDIHCLMNYYGEDCTQFCEPDTTHYVCDGEGDKVCLPGWTGSDCLTSIDDCRKSVCLNSATCEDLHNAYRCHCTEYYTGRRCEIKISKQNAVNESGLIYTSESATPNTDKTRLDTDETDVTIMNHHSPTQQSLDHVTMISMSVTNPIEEISSVETDTKVSPIASSEFTFTSENEITVTHYEEVTEISTLNGMEVISSSDEATGKNPSSNLMEVTGIPNETSRNENFETSTFDNTADITESRGATDSIQLTENNYTPVDFDITTETVPKEINETSFSHELTFVSNPPPTETMSTEVLDNTNLSFPSNTGVDRESTEANTYSASFNFASSTDILEIGESSTISFQTELTGTEEVRQSESTISFQTELLGTEEVRQSESTISLQTDLFGTEEVRQSESTISLQTELLGTEEVRQSESTISLQTDLFGTKEVRQSESTISFQTELLGTEEMRQSESTISLQTELFGTEEVPQSESTISLQTDLLGTEEVRQSESTIPLQTELFGTEEVPQSESTISPQTELLGTEEVRQNESTISFQTELFGTEEMRQSESTDDFSSPDLFKTSTNRLDISSTDAGFQSSDVTPENITNNTSFTSDGISTTMDSRLPDGGTEETKNTEAGLETVYSTSVTNSFSQSTVLEVTTEQTTSDAATVTRDLSGDEVTSVIRAESSSNPASGDRQSSLSPESSSNPASGDDQSSSSPESSSNPTSGDRQSSLSPESSSNPASGDDQSSSSPESSSNPTSGDRQSSLSPESSSNPTSGDSQSSLSPESSSNPTLGDRQSSLSPESSSNPTSGDNQSSLSPESSSNPTSGDGQSSLFPESSSNPTSGDRQSSSTLDTTSTEESNVEIITSTMDLLIFSEMTNTQAAPFNSEGTTPEYPFHTTDNDRNFASPTLPTLSQETVDTGSTFTSSENANVPSLSTTDEIEITSTQSVVLSSSSSQELNEIQNATNVKKETTNLPPEPTSKMTQTSLRTTQNEMTSETNYTSSPEQTTAHTEPSSLTVTIKNTSTSTLPSPTKVVDELQTQDKNMSSAKSFVEHTTLPTIPESQTVFTDSVSHSDFSGLSSTTAGYPSQTLYHKTSEQVQTNFELSTFPSTLTSGVLSSTDRPKPETSSTTPSLTCRSKYFVDAIGELVIEVNSKYEFPVVEKEMLKIMAEHGVSEKELKFNHTSLDSIFVVWLRFDSRTLPLKISEIKEISLKACRSLLYPLNELTQHEPNKELSSGVVAAITVSLLYLATLLVIAAILIYRTYKRRRKIGSTTLLSEKTCTTRATIDTTLETESAC